MLYGSGLTRKNRFTPWALVSDNKAVQMDVSMFMLLGNSLMYHKFPHAVKLGFALFTIG